MTRECDNPGGSLCTNRYDILDRVTSLVWRAASGAVAQNFAFRYNIAGMITNLARSGVTNNCFYDSLDRLTNETRNGASAYSKSYFYDLSGNRAQTVIAGATDNYTYETVNGVQDDRLISFGTGTSIQYDLAGNATNILYGVGHAYNTITNTLLNWNGCYQLTRARAYTNGSPSGVYNNETYGYDALGRRAWTSRNWGYYRIFHVYDGPQVVADLDEYTGNKVLRTYTYGPGTDQLLAMTVFTGAVPRTYFTIRDHQNTVWALTDTNGVVVESYDFDAWGRVLTIKNGTGQSIGTSALGNHYLFQGREYSWVTGLYYFRARWYDPVTGRWLSNDPIGISGSINQYVAFENNPINRIDPEGRSSYYAVAGLVAVGVGILSQVSVEIQGSFFLDRSAIAAEMRSNATTMDMFRQVIASKGEMDWPENFGQAGQMGTDLPPQGGTCEKRQKVRNLFESMRNIRGYSSAGSELATRLATGAFEALPKNMYPASKVELAKSLLNRQQAYQNFLKRIY